MSRSWELAAGLDDLRARTTEGIAGVEAGQTPEIPETESTEPNPLGSARYEILETMHAEFFGKDFEEMGDPNVSVDRDQLAEPIFATLQGLQGRGLISKGIAFEQTERIFKTVMDELGFDQQLVIRPEDITAQVDRTIRACAEFGYFDVEEISLLEEEEQNG